jgi:hypothetical protein
MEIIEKFNPKLYLINDIFSLNATLDWAIIKPGRKKGWFGPDWFLLRIFVLIE